MRKRLVSTSIKQIRPKTNEVEIKTVVHAQRAAVAGNAVERKQSNGPPRDRPKAFASQLVRETYVSGREGVSPSLSGLTQNFFELVN